MLHKRNFVKSPLLTDQWHGTSIFGILINKFPRGTDRRVRGMKSRQIYLRLIEKKERGKVSFSVSFDLLKGGGG